MLNGDIVIMITKNQKCSILPITEKGYVTKRFLKPWEIKEFDPNQQSSNNKNVKSDLKNIKFSKFDIIFLPWTFYLLDTFFYIWQNTRHYKKILKLDSNILHRPNFSCVIFKIKDNKMVSNFESSHALSIMHTSQL